MPREYDNELRGALFRNTRKRPGKEDPEYQGQAQITGIEFWVDAWVQTSKKGDKFMSLRFRAKEDQPERAAAAPDDDDIPF